MSRIIEIQKRVEAATPGKKYAVDGNKDINAYEAQALWVFNYSKDEDGHEDRESDCATISPTQEHAGWSTDSGYPGYCIPMADAEFCAHAYEDVPFLLAEVDRLRAALERIHAEASALPESRYDELPALIEREYEAVSLAEALKRLKEESNDD